MAAFDLPYWDQRRLPEYRRYQSMDRPTLKAKDVEALCYIYSFEAKSPSTGRVNWWARPSRLLSATAVVAGAVVILAIVWRVLRL